MKSNRQYPSKAVLVAGLIGLLALPLQAPASPPEGEARSVAYSVSASEIKGQWLHDENGNPLGKVKATILVPHRGFAMIVVETTALEVNKKAIIPWPAIVATNSVTDPSQIHLSVQGGKAKLSQAPVYSGARATFFTDIRLAEKYWIDPSETAKEAADAGTDEAVGEKVKEDVKDAVDVARDAVGKGINRAGSAIEKIGRKIRPD